MAVNCVDHVEFRKNCVWNSYLNFRQNIKRKSKKKDCICVFVEYLINQAFIAHIVC